jgi:hypothetical protein
MEGFLPPLGRVDSQTIGVRLEMIWQIDKTRLERIFQTKSGSRFDHDRLLGN